MTKPALPTLGAQRSTPKDLSTSTVCPPSTSTRGKVPVSREIGSGAQRQVRTLFSKTSGPTSA